MIMPTFDTFMLVHFYTASALQAMQTAIIATGCPSVTFWHFVQTKKGTIVRSSTSGRAIVLVSGEVKSIRIFTGDHPGDWYQLSDLQYSSD